MTSEGVACWLVRAGRGGAHLGELVERGLITISWSSIPGLGDLRDHSEDDIRERLVHAGRGQPKSDIDELLGFSEDMHVGDFVVSPDKSARDRFAIGRITGEYGYSEEAVVGDHHHLRPVEWLGWWRRSGLPDHLAKAFQWQRTVRPLPEQQDWLAFIHAVAGGDEEPPTPRPLPVRSPRSAAGRRAR